MPRAIFFAACAAYAVVLVYAALAFYLGPLVPLGTIVVGFGLLIVPYLALEWVATPVVAVAMGYCARWSIGASVLLGVPLVALYALVTPVVSSGDPTLSVPVPWLSVYEANKVSIVPMISERLHWWASLYLLSALAGRLSRGLVPVQEDD